MANVESSSDTVLIGSIISPVNLGDTPAVLPLTIAEKNKDVFDSRRKTWLLLDDAQMITAPDGVYEIYITDAPPQINTLTAASPAFVNVLDFYSITAPGAKQVIEADVQAQANKMFLKNQNVHTVYITLLFNGNRFADGSKSKKAGLLQFSGIRLVQTKE
jgi:hypothetical protein